MLLSSITALEAPCSAALKDGTYWWGLVEMGGSTSPNRGKSTFY